MRLRMVLHVFEGGEGGLPMARRDEEWECDVAKTLSDINPLLLRYDGPAGTYMHMFSLERVDGNTAIFHPYATSPRMSFLGDLPKFGWQKVRDLGWQEVAV